MPPHRQQIEQLYGAVRYPDAIDWWAARYARDAADVTISNARHEDATRQRIENAVWRRIVPPGGRVLDCGCGRGYFSRRLRAALGDRRLDIAALDISDTILRAAQADRAPLDAVLGSAEQLPFGREAFDAVLLISVLEHLESPVRVLRELARVLRAGGYVYLCIHRPFVDPLIAPTVVRKLAARARRGQPGGVRPIGFAGTLRQLRAQARGALREAGLRYVAGAALLHQLEWDVYRAITPRLLPRLIAAGGWLNRLPLGYYKNLEYWLLQKE